MKRCTVAYALADAQWLWSLELAPEATVADALRAARLAAGVPGHVAPTEIDWDGASVGIHGIACARELQFADGDRIEIYRPLRLDPREARRTRVASARRTGRR